MNIHEIKITSRRGLEMKVYSEVDILISSFTNRYRVATITRNTCDVNKLCNLHTEIHVVKLINKCDESNVLYYILERQQ